MATSVITGYGPITDAGEILVGARVFVLDVGTSTKSSIYSDTALSVALDNPMVTDADGFHAQAYLSGSYKIRIETGGTDTVGSGTLIRQWDNIDGGVPIGSGDLAVADGGTGASTAAAARTNLSAPSQSEVDTLTATVAALAGTLGGTDATQIATGTTAQRPSSLSEGQYRRNTTTSRWEGYNGSGWENFYTDTEITGVATQAQQETGTSLVTIVSPGRQHYHVSAAKLWIRCDAAGNISISYNITSITDTATGDVAVTIATDFSTTAYCVVPGVAQTSSIMVIVDGSTILAGSFEMNAFTDAGAAVDPTFYYAAGFGDHA